MKKSISFGLNGVNPGSYGNWPGWLEGCVSDARDMTALCARAGFAAQAVFDSSCTIAKLLEELTVASTEMADGDTFFFSYSGHGGQSPAWSLSGYKETLCLYDGEIADIELRELFSKFKAGVRIVFCSDSCHSGGIVRQRPAARSKPPNIKASVKLPSKAEPTPISASLLLLAACQTHELAMDGAENGAFTSALLQVADDFEAAGKPLIYSEWLAAVQVLMLKNYPTQHPVIEHYGATSEWNFDMAV